MKSTINAAILTVVALLAGCGHSGTVPQPSFNRTADTVSSQVVPSSIVHTGNFTEYSLPAGVNPTDLTRGPYDTVYFTPTTHTFTPAKVYQMNDVTGRVISFTAPAPYDGWNNSIISYNGSVTYVVVDHTAPGDAFYFAHVTPTGHYSFTGASYFEDIGPTNLVLGADGNIWDGYCIDPCQSSDDGAINPYTTRLTDSFIPASLSPGPGGNIYVTAGYFGPPPPPTGIPDARVYVISLTGVIVHTFALPIGTSPNGVATLGITTGADHDLWITAPGINKILRMTPTGAITQYKIPTASAGPNQIVSSYDFALYFTESNANKIGRITTTGAITEYRIPTANSKPTGITPCSPTHCGTHGGVWFSETNANKIGRFNAPI